MIDCPYCAGSGKVKSRPAPVPLTPLQRRIYDLLASIQSGGLATAAVIERVYPDGAPNCAHNSVSVTIANANRRLAPFKQRIVARGGWCTLKML